MRLVEGDDLRTLDLEEETERDVEERRCSGRIEERVGQAVESARNERASNSLDDYVRASLEVPGERELSLGQDAL